MMVNHVEKSAISKAPVVPVRKRLENDDLTALFVSSKRTQPNFNSPNTSLLPFNIRQLSAHNATCAKTPLIENP